MRRVHYLKENHSTSSPGELLFFDTETDNTINPDDDKEQVLRLRLGVAMAYRREGGRRTRIAIKRFKTPLQFWEFLETRLNPERPLWVFAHNMLFDLTIVNAWKRFANDKWEWTKVILESPPM